jgi:4-hydroxy-tetrahydrodipicolinate reductase
MFHPALRFAPVAGRLDAAARAKQVSITGVGINPGFSFDTLPLLLSRVTSGVEAVRISRTIDVTGTGPGDIEHVGYGLWPDEFREKIAAGKIVGHMGMPESIAAIAERLGMEIDGVDEEWETTTAAFAVDSGTPMLGMLEPGRVIGISQEGRGKRGEQVVISMRLVMFYQPEKHGLEVADTIEIQGAHHVRASLKPAALSLFGAANAIVNATHDVIVAPPGLVSALDFAAAGVRRGGFRYVLDDARQTRPGFVALKRAPV